MSMKKPVYLDLSLQDYARLHELDGQLNSLADAICQAIADAHTARALGGQVGKTLAEAAAGRQVALEAAYAAVAQQRRDIVMATRRR